MKQVIIFFFAWFLCSASYAKECSGLSSFFGICDGVSNAGNDIAKALEAAGYQIPKAGRNIALATNQFGILVQEYHSPDKDVRERARAIIHGVFGDLDIPPNNSRLLEVSTIFDGVNSSQNIPVTMKFVNSPYQKDWIDKMDFNTEFKMERVSNSHIGLSTIRTRADIKHDILDTLTPHWDTILIGSDLERVGQICAFNPQRDKCMNHHFAVFREQAKNALAESILTVMDDRSKTMMGSNALTKGWDGGGFVLLLMPSEFLSSNPNLRAEVIHHKTGKIDEPVRDFKTSPQVVDIMQWRNNPPIELSGLGQYKKFQWVIVSLELQNTVFDSNKK